MKKSWAKGVVGCAASLLVAGAVVLAEDMAVSVLRVQPGATTFRVLEEDGIRPVAESTIGLRQLTDGEFAVSGLTDQQGRCVLTIADGRYVLAVNNLNIAIVQTDATADTREARILLPRAELAVVGQEDDDSETKPAGIPANSTLLAIGGGIVVIGGIIAIGEHNDWWEGDSSPQDTPPADDPAPPPPPPPAPVPPAPAPAPQIPPSVSP